MFQEEEARNELDKEKELESSEEKAASLLQMFRTPNLRVNAFLCTVIW